MKFLQNLLCFLLLLNVILSINPATDYKPKFHKRCNHQKKSHKKNFLDSRYGRKSSEKNPSEIPFEKMRFFFDYTYTLPHEEKMLKELVIPPVKKFFENALSVRKFPGKLRFPNSQIFCQNAPVPEYLTKDGVESDMIIFISTYRGMKKFWYDKELLFNSTNNANNEANTNTSVNTTFQQEEKDKDAYINILKDMFKSKNTTSGNNTTTNNHLPWEINDGDEGVVGWSSLCLQDTYTLRPLAGVMQYVADIEPTPRAIEEAIWTTLHEIMHILAFDFDLFSDFIDADFNKVGYPNTIKVKTRLKGLDTIIKERQHLFDDYEAFVRFGHLTSASTSNEYVSNNEEVKIPEKSESKMKLRKGKSEENKKNASENKNAENIKNIKVVENNESKNSANNPKTEAKNTNSVSNSNTSTKNISSNITNNSTNPSSNYTLTENNFANLIAELTPSINLTLTENFYQIEIPQNFNISTLNYYIENFSENTRISIKTPKVVEFAKQHYSCNNIDSVELEHFGGLGSAFSHWSKRILNTEFMIADSYGENYISNFTLALMEDSGWYKIDYSKAEVIPWGLKKGCGFLEEKCIIKKQQKNIFSDSDSQKGKERDGLNEINTYQTNFNEFCTSYEEEKCSVSHIFRATCGLSKYKEALPKEYQYFDSPKLGGYTYFGDYCPYPLEWYAPQSVQPIGSCRNGIKLRSHLGESVCENCRCFQSSLIEEKVYDKYLKNNNLKQKEGEKEKIISQETLDKSRAACYEAKCVINPNNTSNKKSQLIIVINGIELKCPTNGGTLSIDGYKGFIECPKAESVCMGTLDPKEEHGSTSAYNLFSHVYETLLSFLYDYIAIIVNLK